MFCSTIIPTIGRPTLSKAVYSVLEQSFAADDFEVIVVNDTGRPLPEAGWQTSNKVQVITTNQRERSVARNTGAAIAKGQYLHFLDDDDWLMPDALQHFWDLAQQSEAGWLYGGALLADINTGKELTLHLRLKGNCFIQAVTGEWLPLQASLIKAETFFTVGGFNPLAVPGEDKDLLRRIALYNTFDYTEATVVTITRGNESTTNYAVGLRHGRREREKVLNESGAFSQMRQSARSGYWQGRIVRTYLFSTIWNIQQRRGLTAISRLINALVALLLASRYLFAAEFWQAVTRKHLSRIIPVDKDLQTNI